MQTTHNYRKHTHKNPMQQWLLEKFYQILFAKLQELHPKTLLDVGCGEGFTLNKLREVGIGEKIEGIEYDQTAIDLGRQINPKVKIAKGSIYELPYKNNSFDVVLCTEVLEHLDNPKKALSELIRVSKRYCVLTVPNEPFFMMGNLIRGKNISRLGNDIEHINHWTFWGFKRFVQKSLLIRAWRMVFFWTLIIGEK